MDHQFSMSDDIYNESITHQEVSYNPANDPLTPFIGIFDSGEDGWIERHDEIFIAENEQ